MAAALILEQLVLSDSVADGRHQSESRWAQPRPGEPQIANLQSHETMTQMWLEAYIWLLLVTQQRVTDILVNFGTSPPRQ